MEINRPLTISCAIFIIFGFGFFIVNPKYREFKELQLEISKKEAELKGKSRYFSDLAKIKQALIGNEETLKKIESALPSEFSAADLIYFIQEKSDENGLIFEGISFSGTSLVSGTETTKQSSASLSLFGSYSAFRNFLSSLEKSSRLIEVENVSVSPAGDNPDAFTFALTIKVYSY